MHFSVGNTVIHAKHGLGEVVQIEETMINGQSTACYVVKTRDLMIWVPINDDVSSSLRAPTSEDDFNHLFQILRSPSEPLPEDRKERKVRLLDLISDGNVASLCRLVRDLSEFSHKKKLSEDDHAILERAQNSLLTEWAFSLSVPLPQARKHMGELLQNA
jgi:RNA polymerase-interacting CarD/CdnL/TRCF family regulator